MESITYEGVVYTYKAEHGTWVEDWQERLGTQIIPANADGTPDYDNVGNIEITYYESGGVCDARCALCEYHEAEWRLSEALDEYFSSLDDVRRAHEQLLKVNRQVTLVRSA